MNASLLIPCYNAAAFLPRLLESARAQTLPFAEILCYDDGSSDNTIAVAEKLGLRILRGERNSGVSHARNVLWQNASCDWVHFHDADDLLTPTFLEKMSAAALSAPSCEAVICDARWEYENTRELQMIWSYSQAELAPDPLNYLLTHPVAGSNGLYHRSALARIQGFDTTLNIWEDADLHVRLAAAGVVFRVVSESLVISLRRESSLSTPARQNIESRLHALQRYAQSLPPSTHDSLQRELEIVARKFLRMGDTAAAREALAAIPSGRPRSPLSENLLINLCKQTLGPIPALRLQSLFRRN